MTYARNLPPISNARGYDTEVGGGREEELESRPSAIFRVSRRATGERERRDCIGWTLKEPILREREREPFLFLVTDFKHIVRARSRKGREPFRETIIAAGSKAHINSRYLKLPPPSREILKSEYIRDVI